MSVSDADSYSVETYLINSGALQAYAAIEGGVNVIAIHLGAVFIVRDLFDQMLSHPENFTHMGIASKERVRNDYEPERRTIDLGTVKSRRWQPLDEARIGYASTLAIAALDHLFQHELGHTFNGHTALLKRMVGLNSFPETGASSIAGINNLDRQTLEFDADCFAIGDSTIRVSTESGSRAGGLYTLLCAVYLLHKVFSVGSNSQSIDEVLSSDHPPAHIRLRLILGSCIEVVENYNMLPMVEFGKLVTRVMVDCEEGFARLLGSPVDPNNLLGDAALTDPLLSMLLENWKLLRPQLLPLSFDGRLNP